MRKMYGELNGKKTIHSRKTTITTTAKIWKKCMKSNQHTIPQIQYR